MIRSPEGQSISSEDLNKTRSIDARALATEHNRIIDQINQTKDLGEPTRVIDNELITRNLSTQQPTSSKSAEIQPGPQELIVEQFVAETDRLYTEFINAGQLLTLKSHEAQPGEQAKYQRGLNQLASAWQPVALAKQEILSSQNVPDLQKYIDGFRDTSIADFKSVLYNLTVEFGLILDPSVLQEGKAINERREANREVENKELDKTVIIENHPTSVVEARQTVSTLSPEATAANNAALESRIAEARKNVETYSPDQAAMDNIDAIVAAYIRDGWSAGERRDFVNLSDQEVIARVIDRGDNLDNLFRKAIVKNRLAELTDRARAKANDLEERLQRRANAGKFSKFANFIGTSALGIIGGTFIRNIVQQSAVQAGWQSINAISGVSGLAAGAVVGGITGGFKGYRKATNEAWEGSRIINDIEAMNLPDDEKLAVYEQLLNDNRVRGQEGRVYQVIEQLAAARAQREFNDALNSVEPIPNETPEQKKLRLAIVLKDLQRQRISPNGSELKKNEELQKYLGQRNREVLGKTLKDAAIGALQWSAFGGIFGLLFPAPGLQSQINARNVAQTVGHFFNPQEVHNAAADINQIVAENANNTNEANRLVGEYIKDRGLNIKDMVTAITNGEDGLAKQIAYRLGVDLNHQVAGHGTLLDMAKEFVTTSSAANEAAGTTPLTENTSRGLFHLLSHADAIGEHWDSFIDITRNSPNLVGHEFTAQVIHGGVGSSWPFTGGPLLPGGEMSNDMSQSAREYLAESKNMQALGTETPWFPFLAWFMSSNEAKWLSEKGAGVVDQVKKRVEKQIDGQKPKTEAEKNREKLRTDRTGVERFDKRIFDMDKHKDTPLGEKLMKQQGEFVKRISERHGQFFFVKEGDEIFAYRLWPYRNKKTKQTRSNNINNPYDINERGTKVGDPDWVSMLHGKVMVQKYELSELDHEPIDKKMLEKNWDQPHWGSDKRNIEQKYWYDLFRKDGEFGIKQTFIHPTEIPGYAHALRREQLNKFEELEGGQENKKDENSDKFVDIEDNEGKKKFNLDDLKVIGQEGVKGIEAQSSTDTTNKTTEAKTAPETPALKFIELDPPTSADDLEVGTMLKTDNVIIQLRELNEEDQTWLVNYLDEDNEWQSAGQEKFTFSQILGKMKLIKYDETGKSPEKIKEETERAAAAKKAEAEKNEKDTEKGEGEKSDEELHPITTIQIIDPTTKQPVSPSKLTITDLNKMKAQLASDRQAAVERIAQGYTAPNNPEVIDKDIENVEFWLGKIQSAESKLEFINLRTNPEPEPSKEIEAKLEELRGFASKKELEPKQAYEASIEKATEILEKESGLVELKNKEVPTVVIPDLHARRELLMKALSQKIETPDGKRSVLELLTEGKINVVCLGDGMHSESADNWKITTKLKKPGYEQLTKLSKELREALNQAKNNHNDPKVAAAQEAFNKEEAIVKKEMMKAEIIRSLGLMKMVMDLKAAYPDSFHFIRGNHDSATSDVSKLGEHQSILVKEWIIENFGQEFFDKFAQFEKVLPSMIIDRKADGREVVYSHSAPAQAVDKKLIEDRDFRAYISLSTGENVGKNVVEKDLQNGIDATLSSVGVPNATMIIGHRPVEEGTLYRSQLNNKLIQINDPKRHIIAVVPSDREFNPEKDITTI